MEDEEPSIVVVVQPSNEPNLSVNASVAPNDVTTSSSSNTKVAVAIDPATEKTRAAFDKLIEYIMFHFQNNLHSNNADSDSDDDEEEGDAHHPHHFMVLDTETTSGSKHSIVNSYGLRMTSLDISKHAHVEGDEECDTPECGECHCEGEKTATHVHIETSFDSRCAGSIDTFSAISIERAMRLAFDHFKLYKKCSNCYEKHMGPASSNKCAKCTLDELFECPEMQCPICLDTTTCFITLPCNTKHKFHHHCWNAIAGKVVLINGSHRYTRSCPMCRAKIYNTESGLTVWHQPPSAERASRTDDTTIRNETGESTHEAHLVHLFSA